MHSLRGLKHSLIPYFGEFWYWLHVRCREYMFWGVLSSLFLEALDVNRLITGNPVSISQLLNHDCDNLILRTRHRPSSLSN